MTIRPLSTRRAGAVAGASTATATDAANPTAPPQLRVSIGELRLPGLTAGAGDHLAAAFRGELAARLAGAPLAASIARERLLIDRFAPIAGERAEDTGRRLAVAIAGVLTTRPSESMSGSGSGR